MKQLNPAYVQNLTYDEVQTHIIHKKQEDNTILALHGLVFTLTSLIVLHMFIGVM